MDHWTATDTETGTKAKKTAQDEWLQNPLIGVPAASFNEGGTPSVENQIPVSGLIVEDTVPTDLPQRKAAIERSLKVLKVCEKKFPKGGETDKSDIDSLLEALDSPSAGELSAKIIEAECELSELWNRFLPDAVEHYSDGSIPVHVFPNPPGNIADLTKETVRFLGGLVGGGPTRSVEEMKRVATMVDKQVKDAEPYAARFSCNDTIDEIKKGLEKLKKYFDKENPLAGFKAAELCGSVAALWNEILNSAVYDFTAQCSDAEAEVAAKQKEESALQCSADDIESGAAAIKKFLDGLPAEQDRVIRIVTVLQAKRLQERLDQKKDEAVKCSAKLNDQDIGFVAQVIKRFETKPEELNHEGYRNALVRLEKMGQLVVDQGMINKTIKEKLPIERADVEGRFKNIAAEVPPDDVLKLATQMRPDALENLGPGPLGYADPDYSGSNYPEVKFIEEAGKFRFEKTKAVQKSNHRAFVMPIGEKKVGDILSTKGEKVTVEGPDGPLTYTLAGFKGNPESLWRGVSKNTYKEVEIRELEHLVDFHYAFTIGVEPVATAINTLSSSTYASKQEAIQELVAKLPPQLVPANPLDEESWIPHLKTVTMNLCGLSKDRDYAAKGGTHCPSGYTITYDGKRAIIEPLFKSTSLLTKDIISLKRI